MQSKRRKKQAHHSTQNVRTLVLTCPDFYTRGVRATDEYNVPFILVLNKYAWMEIQTFLPSKESLIVLFIPVMLSVLFYFILKKISAMLVVLLFVQISSLAKRNCEENIKKESTQSCHCWYARVMAHCELFVYYNLILKKSNQFWCINIQYFKIKKRYFSETVFIVWITLIGC